MSFWIFVILGGAALVATLVLTAVLFRTYAHPILPREQLPIRTKKQIIAANILVVLSGVVNIVIALSYFGAGWPFLRQAQDAAPVSLLLWPPVFSTLIVAERLRRLGHIF